MSSIVSADEIVSEEKGRTMTPAGPAPMIRTSTKDIVILYVLIAGCEVVVKREPTRARSPLEKSRGGVERGGSCLPLSNTTRRRAEPRTVRQIFGKCVQSSKVASGKRSTVRYAEATARNRGSVRGRGVASSPSTLHSPDFMKRPLRLGTLDKDHPQPNRSIAEPSHLGSASIAPLASHEEHALHNRALHVSLFFFDHSPPALPLCHLRDSALLKQCPSKLRSTRVQQPGIRKVQRRRGQGVCLQGWTCWVARVIEGAGRAKGKPGRGVGVEEVSK